MQHSAVCTAGCGGAEGDAGGGGAAMRCRRRRRRRRLWQRCGRGAAARAGDAAKEVEDRSRRAGWAGSGEPPPRPRVRSETMMARGLREGAAADGEGSEVGGGGGGDVRLGGDDGSHPGSCGRRPSLSSPSSAAPTSTSRSSPTSTPPTPPSTPSPSQTSPSSPSSPASPAATPSPPPRPRPPGSSSATGSSSTAPAPPPSSPPSSGPPPRGDPAQWLQLCAEIDSIKAVLHGKNTRFIIVIVQSTVRDDVSEDLMIALRKRAEIDPKYLVVFVQNDASELSQSLNRLAEILAELGNTYYREEGRRVKTRIEKKSFNSVELNIHYCFKVAIFAEFRRDWAEALRFYEDAYRLLREMIGTSTRLPPVQRLVEIKAVAEQLHFKISTLLLHGGKVVEAIAWFHKHVASYQRVVGTLEVSFLHWEWFSRQYLVFAELLETSSASIPSSVSSQFGSPENPLTEWEFQAAYYYQLSAQYLREKKRSLDQSLATIDSSERANSFGGSSESVIPSVYVGQFARLVEHGETVLLPLSDAEYTNYALAEGQRFQDSYEIIALLRRSCESFNNLKAPRIASYCSNIMAREYFSTEDYTNAKKLFDGVAGLYRQEGWVNLLWESLGYLRECSRKLGSPKEFFEFSLEMAALPVFSNNISEEPQGMKNCGPAGPANFLQRKKIQEEVFAVFKGEHANEEGDSLNITADQPIRLEVDLVSPLRAVLLASVAFHDQSVKPGTSTFITLSLLSQLPCPVEVDQMEIQFNQDACNFKIISAHEQLTTSESIEENQGIRVETTPSLTAMPNKWLRLTFEIKSGQSGKLECLTVTAKVGSCCLICCQAESPSSMDDLPLWKFEDRVETFPTKDPGLAYSGQKFIQVEEPEPQVDLTLSASGPALVGEKFIVPVSVVTRGQSVHSGELKINLVDARGGGLLMSPRIEESSTDNHHVELLSVSGIFEEEDSQMNHDNIKKIQQSFGVVSVPVLGMGESWSCKLEIKWHKPKSVMLYVSLGYSPSSTTSVPSFQRVNVHRSLQIEGKIPVSISHRFLMPFRREPMLLSRLKSSQSSDEKVSLALNEASILVVSARNCTEVPLRLISVSIETDGSESISVRSNGGGSGDSLPLVPGEEFRRVFSITPHVESPNLDVGALHLKWERDSKAAVHPESFVVTEQKLPDVRVEEPPMVVSLECPPHAVLGVPFSFYVRVQNLTSLLQEIKYSLGDSQSFVFAGSHNDAAFILPKTEHIISYKLVPLGSGSQQLPRITITSVRYSAALNPSVAATTVFVFPTEPKFNIKDMVAGKEPGSVISV